MCASDTLNGEQAVSEPGQQALKITDPRATICRWVHAMTATRSGTGELLLVSDPLPWYVTPPTITDRCELEDEHTRILAQAVGDVDALHRSNRGIGSSLASADAACTSPS